MTEPQGILTDGRAQLVEWMAAAEGRTQGFVARKLGISQPAVRNWIQGTSRPENPYRDALEALCGIPPKAWELPEEREKRDQALARIRDEAPSPHDSGELPAVEPGDGTNG